MTSVHRPLRWLVPVFALMLLVGCGGAEEAPTPTPTKTPTPAVAATEPTATPVPPAEGSGPPPTPTAAPPPAEPATAVEEPAPAEPAPAQVTVQAAELNVRSGPGTTFAVVTTLRQGETVQVVATSEDGQWYQVARDGQTLGWAAAAYLAEAGEESPPAVEVAPAVDQPTGNYPPPTMLSPDYGAQAFLWWRPEIAERDLKLMREAGFNWVKQTFAWETIEGAGKGQFDWSIADRVVRQVNASGLKLLARVSSDPERQRTFWAGPPPASGDHFADFLFALASRYNCTPQAVGCIQAYQVWNEPNLAREWGGKRPNPAEYAAFLAKAYAAIKRGNPNALVISAGMAPTGTNDANAMPDDLFYEQMYQAMGGNSDGYFDMLGVHGAGFAAPPELDPAEAAANSRYGGYRFFAFRRVEDIRNIMVRYGDADKRVVILEFGWTFDPVNPAYKWHGADAGIDQFVQADYLKRAYIWAEENWQPWIGLMSLLTMPNLDWLADGNPQDEEQYWWAIMEPSPIDQLNFRAAFIVLCDHFNRKRGQFCPYDPARQ